MRGFLLIFYAAISALFADTAQAADQQCIDVFQGRSSYPRVNVQMVPLSTTVQYDRTLDRQQLKQKSQGQIALHSHSVINGLTVGNLRSGIKGNFSVATLTDGSTCVWPSLVEFQLGYSSMVVYVAREFAPGSCQYDVTLRHEREHVKINDQTLRSHVPAVKNDLVAAIARDFPKRYRSSGDISRLAISTMKSTFERSVANLVVDRNSLHGELDSPESYRYWQSLCDRW